MTPGPSPVARPAQTRDRRRRVVLAVALSVSLSSGCGRPPEALHQKQVIAFGTLIDIDIAGGDAASAQRASAAVIRMLNALHHRWHAWEDGPLTEINAGLARGEAVALAPDQAAVIREAQALSRASGGLFNPAIGRLIGLWGFHLDERPADMPAPSPAAVRELAAQRPSMDDLRFDGDHLRSRNPAVQLDLGAYVKGYGVDLAIEELRRRGIDNALVNAGGDLRAIGRRDGRPWRIGIRDPRGPGVLASLDLADDESVYTSGDYERYFEYQGRRYQHIIDPRSGEPATGATSATVVYPGGRIGGGASTALMVAGPDGWQAVVRGMRLQYAMLVGADGTVYLTPAMAARIRFTVQPAPPTVVAAP